MSEARPRDRFIEKVGCFLIAIPVGAFIVTATAEALGVPPAGVFVGAALVAAIAGGFGTGSRTAPTSPAGSSSPSGHAPAPRRTTYEQMREIVDRYENGEINAERRDAMIRNLRR
jgi:hypothetical protein